MIDELSHPRASLIVPFGFPSVSAFKARKRALDRLLFERVRLRRLTSPLPSAAVLVAVKVPKRDGQPVRVGRQHLVRHAVVRKEQHHPG